MNEQEAMALRARIKQEFPAIHVDIHWEKPAGQVDAVHTLWLWKTGEQGATLIPSLEAYEQWKRATQV